MYIISADLGSVNDPTAVSVVRAEPSKPYHCGHLERWHDTYPETCRKIAALAKRKELADAVLVCDQTGVGRPVVDMLREMLPIRRVIGITITSGSVATTGADRHDIRVPKKLLVSTLQVLLGTKRMTWSRELVLMPALQTELANFKIKITPALNEQYEAWREADHDDLVLSLAMAGWLAENLPRPFANVRDLVINDLSSDEPDDDRTPSRMEAIASDHPDIFDEPRESNNLTRRTSP